MSTIKTIAHPNELTKDVNNDFYLLPMVMGTLYTDDIVKRMEKKQIATDSVNGPAFVKLFNRECILAVSEGFNVVTDLCQISLSIRGTVYDRNLGNNIPAEQVDVRMSFVQGSEARKAIKDSVVNVAEQAAPTGPVVQRVSNPIVNMTNTVNIGDMVLVEGRRIAVSGNKIDEIGVFFTSLANGTTVHIPVSKISPNTPSKLQFILPAAVTAGEWSVAVVTQSGNHSATPLEKARRYEYPRIVTVVE